MSAAEVVRRCGPNGPAYTTVSNTGSKLGEYIRLRMSEQAARVRGRGPANSLADDVLDPVLQAQIRDKESIARWLRKENSALRGFLKTLKPGVDIDGAIAGAAKNAGQIVFAAPAVTAVIANDDGLSSALLKLLDHLVGIRQYVLTNGRLTINKKVVLDATDIDAVRRATLLTQDVWDSRYGSPGTIDAQR